MPREFTPEISSTENRKFNLAYMREFRQLLRENPGIIKTATELMEKAGQEYNPPPVKIGLMEITYDKEGNTWVNEYGAPYKENKEMILCPGQPFIDNVSGLEVTLLGRSNRVIEKLTDADEWERYDKSDYFKIKLKDRMFFIKKSSKTTNPGFTEFKNTRSAQEVLKGIPYVKVLNAQLGYSDKQQSWYVSDWIDLEQAGFQPVYHELSHDDYGNYIHPSRDVKLDTSSAGERLEEIIKKLSSEGFEDISPNLFYNPNTDSFIFLDATKAPTDIVGGAFVKFW